MIKILKKQWFVVLIALIFIGFAIFSVYDTNKGKLPGKSVDGKDVVAGLKGDVNITADELYKNLSKTYGKSMLFMKFQAEVKMCIRDRASSKATRGTRTMSSSHASAGSAWTGSQIP